MEELKDTLPQWRRKSSFGRAAIAREKAALTFDSLINFAERQPAEHCPQEQAGRDLHPATLERNTQPNPSWFWGFSKRAICRCFLGSPITQSHGSPCLMPLRQCQDTAANAEADSCTTPRPSPRPNPLALPPLSIYTSACFSICRGPSASQGSCM